MPACQDSSLATLQVLVNAKTASEPQERAHSFAAEPVIDTDRSTHFPNLEEATLQARNPELFAYIRNVEDVIAQLLTGKS